MTITITLDPKEEIYARQLYELYCANCKIDPLPFEAYIKLIYELGGSEEVKSEMRMQEAVYNAKHENFI